ncbi:MAG: phospholipid scramblase-related protein [Acidimicrobiia bacterium]
MSDPRPDGWYPDPAGRHEHRYRSDGVWTEHVADGGVGAVDPINDEAGGEVSGVVPTAKAAPERIRQQAAGRAGAAAVWAGDGSLLGEPILVVNQKAKLIELSNEYLIYDGDGNQVGAVRQVGQSKAKKLARLLTSLDQFMTHRLQIIDTGGQVQLTVTRPAKFVKSRFEIGDGDGRVVGTVSQQNVFGKIRFSLEAGGQDVGSINAENWRAWNFNIQDSVGDEVARITKTWEGLAKTVFTTADNYVVQIHRRLQEPLRSLVIASALTVDTALKQDSRGLS